MPEIWMPIRDFPKYLISPEGLVKNKQRRMLVKTRQNAQGIVMVNLMGDGRRHTRSVALLVAQTYLSPPRNPSYNSIIFLDGDRSNCSALNLMWRPRWYAVRYHKMFEREPMNISVMIEDTGETFGTLREACMKYGLDEQYTYIDMLNGDPCFHYGYRFRHLSE